MKVEISKPFKGEPWQGILPQARKSDDSVKSCLKCP